MSSSATGPRRVIATRHALAVSFASPGRITTRRGIARSDAACSTGWCVGPSSPTPMLSWVKTKIECSFMIDASRIDGRM